MSKDKQEIKKYILVQSNYTLSYTDKDCFINDKPIEIKEEATQSAREICFDKQKEFYSLFLKRHFKNLIILAGAGTSMDNGDPKNSGKSRIDLWGYCQNEIDKFKTHIKDIENKEFFKEKDIEGLLSYIILYEKLNGQLKSKDVSDRELLEKKIAEACKLDLNESAPHVDFLNKITSRKTNDPRVQLFTLNYDLLFEMAANKSGFVVIDGFSFTQPRIFSGRYFDLDIVNREKTRIKHEESFISKVFHYYKLHGSLNWQKNIDDKIIQVEDPKHPLIIYPADEKYESSYEQPYFEMMSRFQQSLRKENTLLIVIGFGFKDKHIRNIILEAVEQNPSFQLLIVSYSSLGDGGINTSALKHFFNDVDNIEVKRGVNIIFDSFANFTKYYPTNNTYLESDQPLENESI